jgi:hypothetical protein
MTIYKNKLYDKPMEENSITVWFDRTYDPIHAAMNRTVHLSLCKIDPYLLIFRDSSKCIDYIINIEDDKSVIMIVSSNKPFISTDSLLNMRNECSRIHSVCILYVYKQND